MKFALAFEKASKTLSTFTHNVFTCAKLAEAELARIQALCFERGSGMARYYSIQEVQVDDSGQMFTKDGRPVEIATL